MTTEQTPQDGFPSLQERAKECARVIQAMALQPVIFSNADYLTKWFEVILEAEHRYTRAQDAAAHVSAAEFTKIKHAVDDSPEPTQKLVDLMRNPAAQSDDVSKKCKVCTDADTIIMHRETFESLSTPTDESKRAALEAFRYIKDVVLPQYERLRNAVKKQDGMEHLLSGVYKLREYKAELDTLSAALSAVEQPRNVPDSKAVVDVEELKDEVRRYFNAFATEYLEMMHNHGDAIIDYLASQGFPRQQVRGWNPTHRHVKRGTEYERVGAAQLQVDKTREFSDYAYMIVYRGEDGRLWVRPVDEFIDGRFEPLPAPSSADGKGV